MNQAVRRAPVCFVPRLRAALGLSFMAALLGCAPRSSTGSSPSAPDAGTMDASNDAAGHQADAGANDAGSNSDAGDPEAGAKPNGYVLASPPDWFDDFLVVPPGFAPSLPLRGVETTREPPGMYDPMSDQFFSYAFLWRLEGNPALDVDSLRSDIRTYYQGLCGAATVALEETPTKAQTAVRAPTAAFSGTLETGSCFNRPTPTAQLEISAYDCPNFPSVLTLISSFPSASEISLELAALRDGFDCY